MSARINETLIILNDLVEKSRLKAQLTGMVLTGGFANLVNLREIAIPIFGNMSVRIAKPKEINGLFDNLKSPEFSTSIGLVIYALGNHSSYEIDSNRKFRSKYSSIINTDINTPVEYDDENIFNDKEKPTDKEKIVNLMDRENKNNASIFEKFKIWLNGIF